MFGKYNVLAIIKLKTPAPIRMEDKIIIVCFNILFIIVKV
jgi:hypothetical protein